MTIGTLNYQDLLQTFPPRPIHNELQYDATIKKINALIDKGDLTTDEQDFLTLLGTLAMVYEEKHYPDENFELRGVALIKALMAEAGLTPQDLVPVFKNEMNATAVLAGKQKLTSAHMSKLATFFSLPEKVFTEAAFEEFVAA